MFSVELYGRVRHACHIEGLSQREAARRFGIHRNTVRKMLAFSVPPGYRRASRRAVPSSAPSPRSSTRFWRRTGRRRRSSGTRPSGSSSDCGPRRLCRRLYDREGLRARASAAQAQEMFVPLGHPPGHAQADFGEAVAVIGGRTSEGPFLLPGSAALGRRLRQGLSGRADGGLSATGTMPAFDFFGGVPQSILYDNTRLAVARILGDGTRQRTRSSPSCSPITCSTTASAGPARATTRARWRGWSVMPGATSWCRFRSRRSFAALNAHLEQRCLERLDHRVRGHDREHRRAAGA